MGIIIDINPKRNQGDAGNTTKTEIKSKAQKVLYSAATSGIEDVIIISKDYDGAWGIRTTYTKPEDVLMGLRVADLILISNISI